MGVCGGPHGPQMVHCFVSIARRSIAITACFELLSMLTRAGRLQHWWVLLNSMRAISALSANVTCQATQARTRHTKAAGIRHLQAWWAVFTEIAPIQKPRLYNILSKDKVDPRTLS